MGALNRELVFLILQFLEEEKYKDTVHRLEQESGFFFNMRYFEEMATNGELEEALKYLSGYTKVEDNLYSMKIFFEIQKQKYLEALDKKDGAKALEILVKDLKVFSAFNEDLFKEMSLLLTLENFRENERLSKYGDKKSARGVMLAEVKKLIEANPLFRDKLTFPSFKSSRLRTLLNQSLNWQHRLCKNPKSHLDMNSLFVDHSCGPSQPSRPSQPSQPNGAHAPSSVTNPLFGGIPRPAGLPPLGARRAAPVPAPGHLPTNLTGWMANPPVAHPSASADPVGLVPSNISAMTKRPRTPDSTAVDNQNADSEHLLKRTRTLGTSNEVNHTPGNVLSLGYSGKSTYTSVDLPKVVVMTLSQGSSVKSMEFHPIQQILLLVGTNAGEFLIWDLGSRERRAQKNFKVWDLGARSMPLQKTLTQDYTASINRVTWSPDGTLFGVAYSKNIIQIYSYHGGGDIRNHLEIEAHSGSVNDLAFSYPNKTESIVTCGEDRLIKVWNAVTGEIQNQFAGHEAPVYSVCPHFKENIQFIFSTATDGCIKAWLYDNRGSRLNYAAPGHSLCTMAYSDDGARLFSCGTNKDGESFIVEWNESEGAIKRTYNGLGKRATRPVQFDTIKNRYIVAGDEWSVKFWHMDNDNVLIVIDAEGGLPASPCVRFNKEGMFLAVSTNDNGIKILANPDGVRVLKPVERCSLDASRVTSSSAVKISAMATSGATANATAEPSIMDRVTTTPPIATMNSENQDLVERNPDGVRVLKPVESRSLDASRVTSSSAVKIFAMTMTGATANATAEPSIMDRVTTMPPIATMNSENQNLVERSGIGDEATDKSRMGKFVEISEPSHCRFVRLPDNTSSSMRVTRLMYTNSGLEIIALAANAVHKLWKWQKNDSNSTGKATASVAPQMWQPTSGILMTNDISDTNTDDSIACFALSKNDSYLASASGGKISLYNTMTFKTMVTLMPPPPPATFLAFQPRDNNIIAIGMDDSSIHIYNVRVDEVKFKLKGHNKRITGLAFSIVLNVLVSSGADSRLCVWDTDRWEKKKSRQLQIPGGRAAAPFADTHVQFHQDQTHLLVVHRTQMAIFEAPKLKCLMQWIPQDASVAITHAAYSCDSQTIYVAFEDGSIDILISSTLGLRCRINPATYLPSNPSSRVYPLVVAAHPSEPNQFALGLTDGGVCVFEPLESEEKWGSVHGVENDAGSSTSIAASAAAANTTDEAHR